MTDAAVITRLLHAIDARDWDGVRAAFADELYTDYTSLWGGSPETVTSEALIAQWTEFVKQFGGTQHLTGPLAVDGDRVEAHVVAHHWQTAADGGQAWVVYGHYIATVIDGKITSLTLQTYRAEGNPTLPSIASVADL
jgi:ketosteroid isomerase-like protein